MLTEQVISKTVRNAEKTVDKIWRLFEFGAEILGMHHIELEIYHRRWGKRTVSADIIPCSSLASPSNAEPVLKWHDKWSIFTLRDLSITSSTLSSRAPDLADCYITGRPEIISLWSNKHSTTEDRQEEPIFQQNYH